MIKKSIPFYIQIGIAIVFLGIAASVYLYNKSFRQSAIKTTGIVVDVYTTTDGDNGDLNYYPTFKYISEQGTVHHYKPHISTHKVLKIGDTGTIYYNPEHPDRALYGENNFNVFALIFLTFGAFILIFMFYKHLKKLFMQRRQHRLISLGKRIIIPASHVFFISRTIEKKSKYQILCQHYDKRRNEVYMYKSKLLDFNPETKIKNKVVSVYLGEKNRTNYFVDTNFIKVPNA